MKLVLKLEVEVEPIKNLEFISADVAEHVVRVLRNYSNYYEETFVLETATVRRIDIVKEDS